MCGVFDVEIFARIINQSGLQQANQQIYELALGHWEDIGGSKLKKSDFIRALYDLCRIAWHYKISYPLLNRFNS